ncbi:MAG: hypothetical protein KDA24_27585 [Deltaproteobacteria bacterium]|nr:hypothetical protein [Deltaproteobacteria bacterium]
MILLWATAALAAEVAVVPLEGPIYPGVATTLLVAAVDDDGKPSEPPPLRMGSGALSPVERELPPGVTAWLWHPPSVPGSVSLHVGTERRALEVSLPAAPAFDIPATTDGVVGRPLTVLVAGEDLPAPDDIEFHLPEGRVVGVEATADGLSVRIEPGPAEYARFVPLALRDLRTGGAPQYTRIRLRARASVALDTEPGTQATLEVGGRIYGPVTAGEDGVVRTTVDQYPGETTVKVLLEDDLGNETTGALPLRTRAESRLLAVVAGELAPGRPAPLVYLHAIRADGRPWDGGAPFCRTPGAREVQLAPFSKGTWVTTAPIEHQRELLATRFVCSLPDGVEASARIAANEDVPARLRLHVWPQDLSTDRPIAEITAALENTRGERLPSGDIRLSANLGTVYADPGGGFVLEGEYKGEAAIASGEDVIGARWDPQGGLGRVEDLQIGWGDFESGALEVHVRALDDLGLPRVGAELTLSSGESTFQLRTNSEGWASSFVPWLGNTGPQVLEARSGAVTRRAIRVPDSGIWRAPGTPLLTDHSEVSISPGRIASIRPTVDPPVLYTGPRAVATVTFEVLDRAGQPVQDAELSVSATEGALGEVRGADAGRYLVELQPAAGERTREVQITATAEGATATATLLLEPRPVDRALSLAAGVHSNLRKVTSPALSLDLDARLPFFNRSTLMRLGISTYGATEIVPSETDDDVRVTLRVVPITAALLARREAGGRGVWLGLGAVIAGYGLGASYGPERFGTGIGVLTPGPLVLAGAGQRFSGGEIMVEARFTGLSGPTGDISFSKQVGGLSLLLGYRLIY